MSGFLVRIRETREIVGFFAAPSIATLRSLVDEATDPNACDYRRHDEGGIFWSLPGTPVVRRPEPDDNEGVFDLDGAECCEFTMSALHCDPEDDRKWNPLVPIGFLWTPSGLISNVTEGDRIRASLFCLSPPE